MPLSTVSRRSGDVPPNNIAKPAFLGKVRSSSTVLVNLINPVESILDIIRAPRDENHE
jgi:hypothetical protein